MVSWAAPCPRFNLTPQLLVGINHLLLTLLTVSFLSSTKHSGFDKIVEFCSHWLRARRVLCLEASLDWESLGEPP